MKIRWVSLEKKKTTRKSKTNTQQQVRKQWWATIKKWAREISRIEQKCYLFASFLIKTRRDLQVFNSSWEIRTIFQRTIRNILASVHQPTQHVTAGKADRCESLQVQRAKAQPQPDKPSLLRTCQPFHT